jgi:hypothetical protein
MASLAVGRAGQRTAANSAAKPSEASRRIGGSLVSVICRPLAPPAAPFSGGYIQRAGRESRLIDLRRCNASAGSSVSTRAIGRNVVSLVLTVPFGNFERRASQDDALKLRIAGAPTAIGQRPRREVSRQHRGLVSFSKTRAEHDGRMMIRQKISAFLSTMKKQGWNIIEALTRDPANL